MDGSDNIDDAVAGMWDRATSEHADSRARIMSTVFQKSVVQNHKCDSVSADVIMAAWHTVITLRHCIL